jgi:hypothetical protein
MRIRLIKLNDRLVGHSVTVGNSCLAAVVSFIECCVIKNRYQWTMISRFVAHSFDTEQIGGMYMRSPSHNRLSGRYPSKRGISGHSPMLLPNSESEMVRR